MSYAEQMLLGIPDLRKLGVPWVSRGTYWRKYSKGEFPAPVKLAGPSSRLLWRAADIRKWLEARPTKL